MNTFKVGRLGASYCWRIGSQHRQHAPCVIRARCLQKRHYADRYTFDDMTQARIDEIYKPPANVELPRENPWRGDFPKNLNDIGYESHCNDRLYMAKNNYRYSQQEYDQKRQERRLEAQERIMKHFSPDLDNENSETRKLSMMQDLAEHQKRQEDIIEMNRKLWQSRPQVKREINLSGITYRPDHQKHHSSQDHDGYRERSEAEKGEAEAETNYWARNLSLVYDPNQPSKAWQKKRDQEIEAQYWHSWNSCPNNQEAETTVELKQHPRRKKGAVHPPPYTRGGQRRSYHQTALYPQPLEAEPEPLANAPLMPKPLRAVPKKEKKPKPKRKRERKSVEPPRFKMTIRTLPLVTRRPAPVPSCLRRRNILSEVAGPSFHMDNLRNTHLGGSYAG
ncbi:hypothetical protein KR054_010975 [Drosophila jambulina]|nr:hypothetical protein KR054_010975 [Drosophila jambulina]